MSTLFMGFAGFLPPKLSRTSILMNHDRPLRESGKFAGRHFDDWLKNHPPGLKRPGEGPAGRDERRNVMGSKKLSSYGNLCESIAR
jgi:hypothetical protein